jgi:prevent-host-death family protein
MTHMAEKVGIRALQQNASAVIARAAAGETVDVTDRGRAVAQIVPLAKGRLAALIQSGLARPARRRVADLAPPIPAHGRSLGDLLEQARSDER